jgi:hypothetical protein
MKVSYSASMTKTELTAIKSFAEKVATHFGESFDAEAYNVELSQRIRVKYTAGNVLAFINLKDTYEVSVDVSVDESYTVEYLDLLTRALPLVGGLINVIKELDTLNESKFEVLETEFETQ